MIRYTTQKPRAYFYDEDCFVASMPSSMTVMEDGNHPADTGLLDQHGRALFRVQDRLPIGFHK